MNGHDHALFGLAAYAGALIVAHDIAGLELPSTPTLLIGATVALGAALAADIDEKHSVSSQGAGVFGSLARAITGLGGGHRTVTHYPVVWVGGLSVLCWAFINSRVSTGVMAIVLGVFAALGFPFIVGPRRRSQLGWLLDLVTIVYGAGVWWAVGHFGITAGWWLYAAIPVPYLAHMIGDTPTPAGVPWLFPLSSRRIGFGLFHSGGTFESMVVSPLLVVACAWSAWTLGHLIAAA